MKGPATVPSDVQPLEAEVRPQFWPPNSVPVFEHLATDTEFNDRINRTLNMQFPNSRAATIAQLAFICRVQVHRIMYSATGTVPINLALIEKMFSSQVRRKMQVLLRSEALFERVRKHSQPTVRQADGSTRLAHAYIDGKDGQVKAPPARRSSTYRLVGVKLMPESPTEVGFDGARESILSPDESSIELAAATAEQLDSCDNLVHAHKLRWRTRHFSAFRVPKREWTIYCQCKSEAEIALGWRETQDRISSHLELLEFSFRDDEQAEVLDSFMQERISKKRPDHEARADKELAKIAENGGQVPDRLSYIADLEGEYRQTLDRVIKPMFRCVQDKVAWCFRTKGRIYGPHTSFPKNLRQYLRIRGRDGALHPLSEVDLGSCFYTILASMSKEPSLIEAVTSGDFYARLLAVAKEKFSFEGDVGEAKKSANRDCLFNHGKHGFGTSALWKAFESLYPKSAKLVWNLRGNNAYAASVLYQDLVSKECALMIERVLPALFAREIPALNLHDAVLVPLADADEALCVTRELAAEYFGFPARVGVK